MRAKDNLYGKSNMRDLLSRPDRGVGATSGIPGVLAALFRKILMDLNINGMRWSHLMDEYVQQESVHHNKDNRRDRTSIRGNLNKEFWRPRMTWKVFCRGLMLLKARRFAIVVVIDHENKRKTAHSMIVDYNTANASPEDQEEFRLVVEDVKAGNAYKYSAQNPQNTTTQGTSQ